MAKLKLTEADKKDILVDIMTLQELAKKIWGDAIYIPEDFGMDVLAWQWHLGQIMTAKNPKKMLLLHLKDAVPVKK